MGSKRASLDQRSPLSAFIGDKSNERKKGQQGDISTNQQVELERTGFYIRQDQNLEIDQLQIKLKRRDVKTNRSEIVRLAVDLLFEKGEEELIKLMSERQGAL